MDGNSYILSTVLGNDSFMMLITAECEVPCTPANTLADIQHFTVRTRVCVNVKRFFLRHHGIISKGLIYLRALYHLLAN